MVFHLTVWGYIWSANPHGQWQRCQPCRRDFCPCHAQPTFVTSCWAGKWQGAEQTPRNKTDRRDGARLVQVVGGVWWWWWRPELNLLLNDRYIQSAWGEISRTGGPTLIFQGQCHKRKSILYLTYAGLYKRYIKLSVTYTDLQQQLPVRTATTDLLLHRTLAQSPPHSSQHQTIKSSQLIRAEIKQMLLAERYCVTLSNSKEANAKLF